MQRSPYPYLLMTFLAGAVSAYDNALNAVFIDTLQEHEQNPFASLIIDCCGVEGLIYIKAITTILAVLLMCRLSFSRWKCAITPVFICQVFLFFYLSFYTPDNCIKNDCGRLFKLVSEIYV